MSLLVYENIYCVPSFHNKVQFCKEVRKTFNKIKPDIIAVELPDIYYSDIKQAVNKLPNITLLCLSKDKNNYEYIAITPSDSIIEGIRLGKENNIPVSFIDLALENYNVSDLFNPPDDYTLEYVELEKFYELNINNVEIKKYKQDKKREKHMAFHLNKLSKQYNKILFICGMFHWEAIKNHLKEKTFEFYHHEIDKLNSPFLAKPGSGQSYYSLLSETPYIIYQYELSRLFNTKFDKWDLYIKLIQETKNSYKFTYENFTVREVNNMISYIKKLAHIDNEIVSDIFNILVAAKNTLGDDYAIELMDRALDYPFKSEEDLPVIEIDKNNKYFTLFGRKIELKRKMPDYSFSVLPENKWIELKIIKKKEDKLPENYISDWFFFGFYSHLPEDKILEGFLTRIKDKIQNDYYQEHKIHPFEGDIMDGLEIRESIRNFYKKQLFVKEIRKQKVNIGAWILLFDEDLSFEKYPWAMSLSAEHHNESDISFYATNPLLHPVSREIIRAEYGALLAIKPPLEEGRKIILDDIDVVDKMRLYQLMNIAIECNQENGILYVADKPPSDYFKKLAESKKQKIYYLPLSSLSTRNLRRLRTFHLLKSKSTRKIADDYI